MKFRVLILACVLMMSGCIDSQNGRSVHLGDVSLGQQLMDLKAALDAEAIDEEEYEELKAVLIDAASACGDSDEEDEDEGFKFF